MRRTIVCLVQFTLSTALKEDMKWYHLPASLFLAAFFSLVTKVCSGTSVGLTNSVYSVREGNGFVKVCVAMGKPNLTVRLRTISGTALPGLDYGEVEHLMSAPDCVNIPIVNDNCMEGVERFNVSLEMVDGESDDIMFGISSATVSIMDDHDQYVADVGFDRTVYEVLKGEDLEVCVHTLCGDSLSILLPLRTKPVLTAKLGDHLDSDEHFREFDGRKQCKNISIPTNDVVESQMTLNFTLSADDNLPDAISLSRSVASVIVKDGKSVEVVNDTGDGADVLIDYVVLVEPISPVITVRESDGVARVCFNVSMEGSPPVSKFTLRPQTENGTAVADEDYNVIEEEFTIQTRGGEGGRIICVNISIKNDSILEDEEEFTVSLKLGEKHTFKFNTSPATIRINDDDFCDAGRRDRAVVSLQQRLFRPSKNDDSIELCANLRIQPTAKCNCPSPFNHFIIRAYTVKFRLTDNSYVESPNPLEMTFHNCKKVCVKVPITPELRAIKRPFFVFLLRPYRQDRRISINIGWQATQVNI